MQYLDWIAFATGIVGTALWAHKGAWAKWASVWWLVSSIAWLAFAWQQDLLALVLEMILTCALVGYGVWNWMVRGGSVETPLPVAESTRSSRGPGRGGQAGMPGIQARARPGLVRSGDAGLDGAMIEE